MGRGKANKRKNSSESSGAQQKNPRNGGSPGTVSVSESLHQANSVLYNDDKNDSTLELNSSVFEPEQAESSLTATAESKSPSVISGVKDPLQSHSNSPSNLDLFHYLKRMDKKLDKLDNLEKKVTEVDGDMKKLWNFVHGNLKDNKEAINKINDKLDTFEFALGTAHEQITQLNNEKKRMQDSLLYLQSQSMRNNLVFTGLTEDSNENHDVTEDKVRTFMVEKMKIAQDIVDGIQLERVHRMGVNYSGATSSGARSRPRNVVAKFLHYKDRETVRRARMNLKGTGYYVNEQFPKEISDRRRELLPKLHQAKREGKNAWISYDTLYIDGRPVRSEQR